MIMASALGYGAQNTDNSIQLTCPTGLEIKDATNNAVKKIWNKKTITWTINNPKHLTPEKNWKPYVLPASGVNEGKYRCKYLKLKVNTDLSASVPANIVKKHSFSCPPEAVSTEGQLDGKPLSFLDQPQKKSSLSKVKPQAGLSGFYIGDAGSKLFIYINPSIYRHLILNTTAPQKLICLYKNGTIKTAGLPALNNSHIYGAIGKEGQMQHAGELNEICIGDDCKNTK